MLSHTTRSLPSLYLAFPLANPCQQFPSLFDTAHEPFDSGSRELFVDTQFPSHLGQRNLNVPSR